MILELIREWYSLRETRRSGLIGGDHFGGSIFLEVGFWVSKAQTRTSSSLFMFPEDHDEELSATYQKM